MSAWRLTLADVARYPRPGTAVPGRLAFRPDGRAVTYLHSAEGSLVRSLWTYDIASGERHVIAGAESAGAPLTREEELRRERTRTRELGITDYAFARDASPPTLLISGGPLLRIRLGDGPLRDLPGTEGALDARPSPDGRRVAFVRAGELHVMALDADAPVPLTRGAEDGLTHGVAEFIAQEELDRAEGYWWSRDGTRLAYVRADSRHIPRYAIVHQGGATVDVEEHRYPFAGAANARVALAAIPAAGGEPVWMDLGADPDLYLARVAWRPDGVLTAQVLSRDQRTLRLIAFTDHGHARLLIEERAEPWINLTHDTRFLDSGEILWASERTGFRHLALHDADGRPLRPLTSGDWMVTRVVGVDEPRRLVYFMGTRESPLERHLYRVALDGGAVERLTGAPGWHDAVLSRDGGRYLDVHSSVRHAPTITVCTTENGQRATLFAAPELAEGLGLPPPEFRTVAAADGAPLHGALYRPPEGTGHAPFPLIVSVYGGPHAQRVADEWSLTVDLRAQYLAQQGYLVFKLDNRGSANRGQAFEAALDRRLGTVEIDDQAAGVRRLIADGLADSARVGIYGWSYGGYLACLALLKAPEVFRVGVAGAPVTDWDGYDTGYTERYLGTPADNPDGYRQASVLTHVDQLRGRLLLVHGGIDENVHFRHTARLIAALTAAGKPYDLLLFPNERHMPRDAKGLEYQEARLAAYFRQHL